MVVEMLAGEALVRIALESLKEHWATQSVCARVEHARYDRPLLVKVCGLLFEKCNRSIEEYRHAVSDFIAFSEEFVRLQLELDRTGHYRFSSYEGVRSVVYDNAELMDRQYLNGMFLSMAFWLNHARMFAYFVDEFCGGNPLSGRVIEVPVGTGIYVSEFSRLNPDWTAQGVDISASSIAYAEAILRLNGSAGVHVLRADIFELSDDRKFDRIICGELLEHLENPTLLLRKLGNLLAPAGSIFLTTAVWAASIDHIYLYKSAQEVRNMLEQFFVIKSELVLTVKDGASPGDEKTPINYACILVPRA